MLNGQAVQVSSAGGFGSNQLQAERAIRTGLGTQVFVSNMSFSTGVDQVKAAFSRSDRAASFDRDWILTGPLV